MKQTKIRLLFFVVVIWFIISTARIYQLNMKLQTLNLLPEKFVVMALKFRSLAYSLDPETAQN